MKHFRQFLVARTVEEAIGLRRDTGPKSLYIAGGTTLVPFGFGGLDVLIDITHLGLDGTSDRGDLISIGGTAKLAMLGRPDIRSAAPVLHKAVSMVGTPPLRNMATLGGSLAGTFLPSDVGITLLALGAEVHLQGDTHRAVPMGDLLAKGWLSGYDLITEVRIKKRRSGTGAGFAKFGRSTVDIALVNAAAAVEIQERTLKRLMLAVGQSGSRPVVFSEQDLNAAGGGVDTDLVRDVARNAERTIKPKADSRASGGFRKHLIGAMVARAVSDAIEEAGIDLAD